MSNTTSLEGKRVLILVLKKQWFDLIQSGEKLEEYRDISKHWIARLCYTRNILDGIKESDVVKFVHGYQPDSSFFYIECQGIDIGYGKEEWGAKPETEYFVIKLGEIIKP